MDHAINPDNLHRTAKIFMDDGRVETAEAAMALLGGFGVTIAVGAELASSPSHQIALLTLVNVARRTFLAGVEVVGLPDCSGLTALAPGQSLHEAVDVLGGRLATSARKDWPAAVIGSAGSLEITCPVWRLTWEGWRGGVVPASSGRQLLEDDSVLIAPALAAAVCAGEVFTYHAKDNPMAGRRDAGLSLWKPNVNWLEPDLTEAKVAYLPSKLWFIGLGNLGQAFAWLLAALPYKNRGEVQLLLQDFDRVGESNDSTSILTSKAVVGKKKTRAMATWLEARGFDTLIEERRFGAWTQRHDDEPGAVLCGVDNAVARMALDKAGFKLVIEAGLGGGTNAFRSFGIHTFPASRTPAQIWERQAREAMPSVENMPAYHALASAERGTCGLTELASRTVGVPFVGVIAGCLTIAELLRRLNGGVAMEFMTGSTAALGDVEYGEMPVGPYEHGHVAAE
jgi:hypothetical protein